MTQAYYEPDAYQFILVNNSIVKLFSSWSGSYLSGDAYRVNSGTQEIVEKECHYLVYGYSGSVYKLRKTAVHMNAYCQGVLNQILENEQVKEITIEQAVEFLKEGN